MIPDVFVSLGRFHCTVNLSVYRRHIVKLLVFRNAPAIARPSTSGPEALPIVLHTRRHPSRARPRPRPAQAPAHSGTKPSHLAPSGLGSYRSLADSNAQRHARRDAPVTPQNATRVTASPARHDGGCPCQHCTARAAGVVAPPRRRAHKLSHHQTLPVPRRLVPRARHRVRALRGSARRADGIGHRERTGAQASTSESE